MEIPLILRILYENSTMFTVFFFSVAVGTMARGMNLPDPLNDLDDDRRRNLATAVKEIIQDAGRLQIKLHRLLDEFVELRYILEGYDFPPGATMDTSEDMGYALAGHAKMIISLSELVKVLDIRRDKEEE